MRWKRGDQAPDGLPYFITSDRGYTVSRTWHENKTQYTAWAPSGAPLGSCGDDAGAKKLCEDHAK